MRELPPPFPRTELLLAMEPAQIAEPLLRYLNDDDERSGRFPKRNILNTFAETYGREVGRALAEGWSWLESNGLLIYCVGSEIGVYSMSRAAYRVAHASFEEFRQATLLPKQVLHPVIAEKGWTLYLSGNYDTAVFAAFKAVEIAVQRASRCPGTSVQLMRAAFRKTDGPLVDQAMHEAEKEALGSLFAGAFGFLRNPVSHRDVQFEDPREAAEQLMIASHLMRIVDAARR